MRTNSLYSDCNIYTGFKKFDFNKCKSLVLYFCSFENRIYKTAIIYSLNNEYSLDLSLITKKYVDINTNDVINNTDSQLINVILFLSSGV
ncbi:MAG TPA: hypothetical protein DHW76_04715 [Clostridiaceae bacterium]|nr:hypothetical protein [Clostridiaceae bacterium]